MKRAFYIVALTAAVLSVFPSCDDEETYAEQKEREKNQIMDFISNHNITVIDFEDFIRDTVTDVSRNEYVLFQDNGVYMQIVRRGEGKIIPSGWKNNINVRYVEIYIPTGDTLNMNNKIDTDPDVFALERKGDEYIASFKWGTMAQRYGYSVPRAWLMPFPYIKPAFLNSRSAKVRLIVPHNQGTQRAASNVYPTFYEIDFSPEQYGL